MKRLLSIILAVSMIISFIPAFSIASAEESVEYQFGKASGIAVNAAVNTVTAVNSSNNNWFYHSASIARIGTNSQLKDTRLMVKTAGLGEWLALEMTIPQTGWYEIQFSSYRAANSGGKGDVYLLPANADLSNIEAAISAPGAIAVAKDIKYYDTTTGAGIVKEASIIEELGAQKYLVVFKVTGSNNADGAGNPCYMYPANLSLEWISNEEPLYSLKAEKEILSAGQSVEFTVEDYNGNPVENYTIKEISSENEDIATVSGNVITAVGNMFGKVRISAILDVGGKEKRAECLIRVIDAEDSGMRIVYALDTRHVNSRGEEWVNPTYEREPGHYKKADEEKYDIAGLVPETDGITADYTDGWSFYTYDPGVIKQERTFFQSNGSFLRIRIAQDQWCAIKINIPETGHYRALLRHIAYNIGGYGAVYLIPVPGENENIEQYMTDAYKLGDFSSYNPELTEWNADGASVATYLGEAYVDNAGDYLLVIRNTGRANELFVNDIILSGTTPLTGVKRAISRNLDAGDTFLLDASLLEWEADAAEYSDNVTLSYENKTPEILELSDDGIITAIGYGSGRVAVTASWNGYEISGECSVLVGSGKTRRSYYTDEKVKNLKNNIARYEWAQDERDKYVEEADKLLTHGVDKLYGMITTQELPRANQVAHRFNDNGQYYCLYCDTYVYTEYGQYPWEINVFSRPWKIQCPECKRLFPSNDFGKFYELGIDEHGNYRFALALQRHHEKFVCKNGESCECTPPQAERGSEEWNAYYGYGVKGGYLYNDTYGEKDDAVFAVDDGWGYEYTYTYTNNDGTPELNEDGSVKTEVRCKPFIGYYNMWGLWETEIQQWITNLSMAYLYTDDVKYGRAAAILIDRIADLFPDFDTTECGSKFLVSDGNSIKWSNGTTSGTSRGKIMGRLHDNALANAVTLGYDAIFPILSDNEVISYLSKKAGDYTLENKKTNANEIAQNIENNFLREAHRCFLDFRLSGNFGVPESCHLLIAVVLDTLPETEEWVNWVFQSGGRKSIYEYTGGNVYSQLITVGKIDRDGHGNEASPSYNAGWVDNMIEISDIISEYDKVENVNLYEHPKMIRMLTSAMELLCVSTTVPNIGDHDRMGRHLPAASVSALLTAYKVIEDEETRENIARAIYFRNGKTTDNLHSSIFDAEPEAIVSYIDGIIKDGRLALDLGSRALTGYGISILRAGDWYMVNDSLRNVNTQRDFFLWYGQTDGHGDYDKLNLGFHAYGLDVGADIGEAKLKNTTDPHRFEMQEVTVAHNTVTVNNVNQKGTIDGNVEHFDDAGRVKVMDAEAPGVYATQGVEEYKRTLVMVDANDDVSYGVDFFHILGGEDHLYSFHVLATEGILSDNVAVESQKDDDGNYIGSYQGIDKKWGSSTAVDDTDGLGTYSWFGEVDRATDPANADVFSMDWKIVDNDKVLRPAQKDLRVRLTMLNSFKLDEITTTSGIPP
ncbi:MAG: heparinase II/III family protein, partial [Oscillospiraceae bacterium]|nr:heparinase II/III family protein [Oscillospiraceae bacterium]